MKYPFFNTVACLTMAMMFGCDSTDTSNQLVKSPRPVSVLTVKHSDPQNNSLLPGSVTAWKTEQIGFQVAGRVETVLEPGRDIEGQTVDENNKVISTGVVIAQLEKRRYELNLDTAKVQKETAVAKYQAKESELKNVIPQQIKSAEAAVVLAKSEFDRVTELFKREAASEAQLDKARANLDTSQADLDSVIASQKVTEAEILSLQAQVREAEENIKQAEKDLADTALRSPFHGQIAEVHQIPGGFVQAGEPVVTIQMMDPISVEVAVSAETDVSLNFNDVVGVILPGSTELMDGTVYEKDTVADPNTRTFQVTLLMRNAKIEEGLSVEDKMSDIPRIRGVWRFFTKKSDETPPYFINVDALHEDEDGFYVWKVENWTLQDQERQKNGRIKLKKVAVTPGEERIPFLQVATMRALTEYGDLDPQQDLVAGGMFDRDGKPLSGKSASDLFADGNEILYVRERWRLRPGDTVKVNLKGQKVMPGYFVPASAILEKSGKKYVFAVESSDNEDKVRQIEVRVTSRSGTRGRIESIAENGLTDGMKIVADGALFLTDGEAVTVVEEVEQN